MLNKFISLFRPKKSKTAKSGKTSEWTPVESTISPEELCGIDPNTMSRDAIKKALAVLYKRHNNAVSSLNPELREEAAVMLDAIVECRERYVDIG